MGNVFSSLFGGGMQMPDTPDYGALPDRDSAETEGAAARDAERKKARAAAGGVKSTLLSNPLGISGGNAANAGGLLGRTGQPQ